MPCNITELETDILIFQGETLASNSTIFVDGAKALVVDALASKADAAQLKGFLGERGLSASAFIISHYFSDHLAALSLFPESMIITHHGYLNTFYGEDYRTDEEAAFFVSPSILVEGRLKMRWGRRTLDIFHAPGHTASTLSIDVPDADLLLCSDNAVGNIAYFYYSHPRNIRAQLAKLAGLGRGRIIQGHGGVSPFDCLTNALHYVDTMIVSAAANPEDTVGAIDSYMAPGLTATEFEEFFHERNRKSIATRKPFYGGDAPPLI